MAVNKVLGAKDVAIVHGPPGTGKTTTLVEAIYETLHRENQVLVCAQSNMAVDWIAEKLVDRGIQVLRIGNPVSSRIRITQSFGAFVRLFVRLFPAYANGDTTRTIQSATGCHAFATGQPNWRSRSTPSCSTKPES